MSAEDASADPQAEIARLKEALAAAEQARKQSDDSMSGILQQLKARSERLIASETDMENMRNQLRAATRDAPGYLRQRVSQADTLRRQAEQHARKMQADVRDKARELSALEGLVMRYQSELSNLAMQASSREADGEELVANVGKRGCVEVWENQRFYHVMGWSTQLLATDRPAFSDRTGEEQRGKDEDAAPPAGTQWLCDWQVDPPEGVPADAQGWTYGFDFPKLENPAECRASGNVDDCVRRRRWVRYYMQHDNESLPAVSRALVKTTFELHQEQLQNARLRQEIAKLKAAAVANTTSPRAGSSRSPRASGAGGAGAGTDGATGDAAAAPDAKPAATAEGGDPAPKDEAGGATTASAPAPAPAQPPQPPAAASSGADAGAAPESGVDTTAEDAAPAAAAPGAASPKKKKGKGKGGKKRRSARRVAAIEDDDI